MRYAMIIGSVVLGLRGFLQAETPQAPVVFNYHLTGPQVLESELVRASGTIKTLTCSWDFEGKVDMEVSANRGISYTKIINGQVLSEGFIPGNELCFKVTLAKGGSLDKVVMGYTDSSGVNRMPVNAELKDFKNHKTIRVSGAKVTLYNYPLKIRLDKKKDLGNIVKEDYSDIRFIASDGATALDYYYEAFSPGMPVFWVKAPQIPKGEPINLYLYYGNQAAPDRSAPEKVFSFFDDFSAQNLNEEKWQKVSGLKSQYALGDGCLEMRDAAILTKDFKMQEGILEYKAGAGQNPTIQAFIQQAQEKPNQGVLFKEVFYSSAYPGAEHAIAVNDVAKLNIGNPIQAGNEYIYKVTMAQDEVIFERYSADYKKEVQLQFMDAGLSGPGAIGLKADAGFLGDEKVRFDWIRARPFVDVEPRAEIR